MIEAMELASEVVIAAIPYAVAFGVARMVVKGFLSMAFGGRIKF